MNVEETYFVETEHGLKLVRTKDDQDLQFFAGEDLNYGKRLLTYWWEMQHQDKIKVTPKWTGDRDGHTQ